VLADFALDAAAAVRAGFVVDPPMTALAAPAGAVDPVGGEAGTEGAAGAAPCAPPPAIREACAAACLHLSDNEAWFCFRQAIIRPPPVCTPEQNFFASSAQPAVRI
jgi:hypothetical protein